LQIGQLCLRVQEIVLYLRWQNWVGKLLRGLDCCCYPGVTIRRVRFFVPNL
jgi:hypothetical protein